MFVSDFANEINAGFKSLLARFPTSRTDLIAMLGNELRGFKLTEKLLGITTDTIVLNFGYLDLTFGIDDKRDRKSVV